MARVLGLTEGDARVILDAGGVSFESATRSLAISAWLLGLEEAILIRHAD
jgi:hypothetical protein